MTTTAAPRRSIAPGQTALNFTTAEAAAESVKVGTGFSATVNGLIVEGQPEIHKWGSPGRKLRVMEKGAQFAIGDFANALEERFGEAAAQILDAEEGWNLATLNVYRWLASRVVLANRRMDRLGIRHHMLVAPLTQARQRHWLEQAAADGEDRPWTVARLKKAIESGEDLPVSGYYVLVGPLSDGEAQTTLMNRLELDGLMVRAIDKRQRRQALPQSVEEEN